MCPPSLLEQVAAPIGARRPLQREISAVNLVELHPFLSGAYRYAYALGEVTRLWGLGLWIRSLDLRDLPNRFSLNEVQIRIRRH